MSLLTTLLGGIQAANNYGTVASGTTVKQIGNGYKQTTIITLATTLPSIAGGANLSVGKLIYTFPAGNVVVNGTYFSVGITQTQAHINANTPDVGIGTTIGSGANATLGAVSADCTNLSAHLTAANCTGTATVAQVGTQLVIPSANAHTVYFNAAANWAASGDAGALLTGTVVIDWSFFA